MSDLARKNRTVLLATLCVVTGMVALSYASVPLYRLFCQVTGWGGTTQVAESSAQRQILAREITVRFNTDVAPGMAWDFAPDVPSAKVRVGQDGFIAFRALNRSDVPVTGTAVYNVTPLKAGKYFYKTQCFCFGEQVLNPGEEVHMPVVFFIDPKIMDDKNMDDVKTITLSYTFFKKDTAELENALEKFYNTGTN